MDFFNDRGTEWAIKRPDVEDTLKNYKREVLIPYEEFADEWASRCMDKTEVWRMI